MSTAPPSATPSLSTFDASRLTSTASACHAVASFLVRGSALLGSTRGGGAGIEALGRGRATATRGASIGFRNQTIAPMTASPITITPPTSKTTMVGLVPVTRGNGRAVGGPSRGAGAAGNQKPQLLQRAPEVRTSAPH